MAEFLIPAFFISFGLSSLIVFLLFAKQYKLIRLTGIFTIASLLFCYIAIIISSKHIPASGDFERTINIVLVLSTVGTLNSFRKDLKTISFSYWYFVLFFMFYVLFYPLEAGPSYFMYDSIWVKLFFQLRIISIALFVYALSVLISCIACKEKNKTALMQRARNYTLLGAGIFLSGEFCGSVWAWLGWGDPWRWSGGFFISTVIFILALASSHLPAKIMLSDIKRIWYQITLLTFILLIYTL